MVEYTKVNVKLTNLQLSKLKKAVKNNDGELKWWNKYKKC